MSVEAHGPDVKWGDVAYKAPSILGYHGHPECIAEGADVHCVSVDGVVGEE